MRQKVNSKNQGWPSTFLEIYFKKDHFDRKIAVIMPRIKPTPVFTARIPPAVVATTKKVSRSTQALAGKVNSSPEKISSTPRIEIG